MTLCVCIVYVCHKVNVWFVYKQMCHNHIAFNSKDQKCMLSALCRVYIACLHRVQVLRLRIFQMIQYLPN